MKHPKEMTDAELCALTDDQIKAAVRRALAEQGLPLTDQSPTAPPPMLIEGDVTVYKVGDWMFCTAEEADAVATVVGRSHQVETEYRYQTKEPLRTVVRGKKLERPVVTISKLVSLAKVPLYEAAVANHEARCSEYDDQVAAGKEHAANRAQVEHDVRKLVSAARVKEDRREAYANSIKEYLDLADGDYVVARRFFERAYPNVLNEFPDLACLLRPVDAFDNAYCGCVDERGEAVLAVMCKNHMPEEILF